MINSRTMPLARIIAALASVAPEAIVQNKVVNELVSHTPKSRDYWRPRSRQTLDFPHRSGEGPRETLRRRKQIATGILRISEARNA